MKIEEISSLLLKDISGQITADEKLRLESWIAENESNAELYRKLKSGKGMAAEYDKWRMIDSNAPLHDMEGRLSARKKSAPSQHIPAIVSVMSIAVAIVAIIFPRTVERQVQVDSPRNYIETIIPGHTMATLTQADGNSVNLINEDIPVSATPSRKSGMTEQQKEDLKAIAMNSLKVPRGGEFHIILEDSTEVWLNAESSLEYPESFDEGERSVTITGEAYFKVHKDESRPFYVTSYGQVVKVYGTEFSVSSYPEDDYVYTTLVEGKVGVLPYKESSSILYLSPDHQSIYAKNDGATVVNEVDSKIVTSWKDGQFVFEDQTLEQIMVKLSRWYDFNYRFQDKEVAAIQFKGRIPRYGKFGDMLEILEKSGGISFSADGNCIVISKKQ